MENLTKIIGTLRQVYRPKYIAFNIASLLIYYLVYTYIVDYQQLLVLVAVPVYLVYALLVTASVLLTISVYSISAAIRNTVRVSGGVLGTFTAVAGAVISGCNCTAPILFGLTGAGLSAASVVALQDFISAYQIPLFWVMIGINLFAVMYSVNRISKSSCVAKVRKRQRQQQR
jgi:hypothetical protein